jgi:hypothetical protein
MARDSLLTKPADLGTFSATQMPRLEGVFEHFYRSYEQYRNDAALWDARYQPMLSPQPVPATTASAPAPAASPVPAAGGR